jgi:hypothetical protein
MNSISSLPSVRRPRCALLGAFRNGEILAALLVVFLAAVPSNVIRAILGDLNDDGFVDVPDLVLIDDINHALTADHPCRRAFKPAANGVAKSGMSLFWTDKSNKEIECSG